MRGRGASRCRRRFSSRRASRRLSRALRPRRAINKGGDQEQRRKRTPCRRPVRSRTAIQERSRGLAFGRPESPAADGARLCESCDHGSKSKRETSLASVAGGLSVQRPGPDRRVSVLLSFLSRPKHTKSVSALSLPWPKATISASEPNLFPMVGMELVLEEWRRTRVFSARTCRIICEFWVVGLLD